MLRRGGYLEKIGENNIFDSKGDAISGIFDRLDKEICKTCTRRIFVECQTVEPPEPESRASPVPDSGTPRTQT